MRAGSTTTRGTSRWVSDSEKLLPVDVPLPALTVVLSNSASIVAFRTRSEDIQIDESDAGHALDDGDHFALGHVLRELPSFETKRVEYGGADFRLDKFPRVIRQDTRSR